MQAVLRNIAKSTLDGQTLAGLTVRDINSLITKSAFTEPSPGAAAWMLRNPQYNGPWKAPDEVALYARLSALNTGNILKVGNFEQTAWVSSSEVLYSKETVQISKPDGSKTVYENGTVPIVKPRVGASRIVVLFSTLFHLQGGMLVPIMKVEDMRVRFDIPGKTLDLTGVPLLLDVWRTVLKTNAHYMKRVEEGETVRGADWVDLLVGVVQSCSWLDYLALHDETCLKFFHALDYVDDNGRNLVRGRRCVADPKSGSATPVVPVTSISQMVPSSLPDGVPTEVREAVMTYATHSGHYPFLLTGPVFTPQIVSKEGDDFKSAYVAASTGVSFRGSPFAGIGVFLANAGYSSVSSAHHNRMCLIVALTFNALVHSNQDVSVCVTIGNIAPIDSTIKTHCRGNADRYARVMYVVRADDIANIPAKYHPKIVITPSVHSHLIRCNDSPPPNISQTLDPTAAFQSSYEGLVQSNYGCREFSLWTQISSPEWFKATSQHPKHEPTFVFSLRQPFDMRGVVTTLKQVDITVPVVWVLKPVSSPQEWCTSVCRANASANVFFLNPASFFSPISNIMKPDFKSIGLWVEEGGGGWSPNSVVASDSFQSLGTSQISSSVIPLSNSQIPDKLDSYFPSPEVTSIVVPLSGESLLSTPSSPHGPPVPAGGPVPEEDYGDSSSSSSDADDYSSDSGSNSRGHSRGRPSRGRGARGGPRGRGRGRGKVHKEPREKKEWKSPKKPSSEVSPNVSLPLVYVPPPAPEASGTSVVFSMDGFM